MRVKISLDIASGLHYLVDHSDIRVEDLNIAGICLDENWQAKIQLTTPTFLINVPSRNGDYSEVGEANHLRKSSMDDDDHLYIQVGESKMYYFGVILFQLLCGRLAVTYDEEGGAQLLSKLARSHYEKGTLTEIIDPLLRVQMNRDSIAIFSEVAYRCLNSSFITISEVIEQLQKVLKLQQGFESSELQQVSLMLVSICRFPFLLG
ncbi:kinase-like domain-containing protein [Tanacetum coccineum]